MQNIKKTKTRQQYNTFRQLRNVCKNLSNDCYNHYIIKTESRIKQDATTFWTFIKNKRRSDTDIPAAMTWKETTASNGEEVINLFASFFKSIYKTNNDGLPIHDDHNEGHSQEMDLSELQVTYDVVYKQMRKLNPKKGTGPYGILNLLLKNCAIGLGDPITHLFDASLKSGIFPSTWKISFICPIHKAGSRSDIANYRPICIQSSIAKLFEKIILPQ